ncbi:Aldo/keto reductase [Myriangium duriaei CBS 260.36]|uniref:Aldo/keto reductase n=1 Tax=Myriangium duriaei CBS 260.36 TaxID=1168546 RepID=A0A9P4IZS5_9PEZI|nr:Aldo/keto reductase [Myriangium duriaei CBS 260.36]
MTEQSGRGGILQGALSMGLSTTSGFHSDKPNPVPEDHDDSEYILPQSFVPKGADRFKIRAKGGDLEASYLSIGAWPWGDKATWNWKAEEREGLTEAWKILVDNGINYIDTAQAYGSGESERICGELVKDMPRDSYIMQTKWWVVPDNITNITSPSHAPIKFLRQSLERLKLDYVDVYMVHGHIHASSIKQVAKGMAECVEQGLTKAVAVGNYGVEDMLKMKEELAQYGIPLALNQCEYHIIRRLPELEGMLKACRENDIVFQSYSSLAQGRLSGKYHEGNEPSSKHRFSSYPMKELEPTLQVLRKIAEKRGVTVAAVTLNYNIGKGVIPVVGVRNPDQANSNCQALGWRLTNEEYKEIDKVSILGKQTKLWQQG